MDNVQHSSGPENNFVIIGSAVDRSGHITQEIVNDWLTRLQQAMSQDRSSEQTFVPPRVDVDNNAADESDIVVEVQEFVPEEEITVVESGEVIRSRPSGECCDVLLHWQNIGQPYKWDLGTSWRAVAKGIACFLPPLSFLP